MSELARVVGDGEKCVSARTWIRIVSGVARKDGGSRDHPSGRAKRASRSLTKGQNMLSCNHQQQVYNDRCTNPAEYYNCNQGKIWLTDAYVVPCAHRRYYNTVLN
jgi:hypothetical protein